jgi:hypothetical protein
MAQRTSSRKPSSRAGARPRSPSTPPAPLLVLKSTALQRNPGGDTDAIKAAGAAQTQGRTQILCSGKRAIPAFRLGSDWRFRRSDLEKWIDDQTIVVVPDTEPENEPTKRKKAKAPRKWPRKLKRKPFAKAS